MTEALRIGDRIRISDDPNGTVKPYETDHSIEVLLDIGKTGTVVRLIYEDVPVVEWDAGEYKVFGRYILGRGVEASGSTVRLDSFRASIHRSFLERIGSAPEAVSLGESTDAGTLDSDLVVVTKCERVNEVKSLLERGANPNAVDRDAGCSVLYAAIMSRQVGIVRALLDAGADPNSAGPKMGGTPLGAARNKNVELTRLLLRAGADVNGTNSNGRTALVGEKNVETVRLLLKAGADPNARAKGGGWTALLMAVQNGAFEVVEELLAVGADRTARNSCGEDAAMIASQFGYVEIGRLFR